jgi:hypothetical protein
VQLGLHTKYPRPRLRGVDRPRDTGIHQCASSLVSCAAILLGPFPQWPAFPASQYYGPSAPPDPINRPWVHPSRCAAGSGVGPGEPDGSHVHPRTLRRDRHPAMPLHHRHDYAAGLHRGLPVRRLHPAEKFPAGRSRRVRGAIRPMSARFSGRWSRLEERSATGSSRMPLRLASRARPIWQYRNDSSLSRTAPPTTPTPRQPIVLQLPNACCDRHPTVASHHRQGSRTPRDARNRPPTTGWVAAR